MYGGIFNDPAATYLALGDRSKAIANLMDACERGLPHFAWTRDDPRLSSLHSDDAMQKVWNSAFTGSRTGA